MCFSLNHVRNAQYLQDQETGHLCSGDKGQPTVPSVPPCAQEGPGSPPAHKQPMHVEECFITAIFWALASHLRHLTHLCSFCQQTQLIKVEKSYLQRADVKFPFTIIMKIEINTIFPNLRPCTTIFFPTWVEKLNWGAFSACRSRWSEQSFPGS